ncbi:MAG: nuclear transport factor 2 family protein [Planctomycetes bacterium]|nr:nuclear transport factor 2 family protein [Planctomycetota bacterium]
MTPVEVGRALWAAIERRDWAGVEALLDPDLRVHWPQSGESFDRAGYLRVNRDYPGDWHVRVVQALDAGDQVVTEVEVDLDGRTDRAVSFMRLRAGRVVALRELWAEPFPVPAWRRPQA